MSLQERYDKEPSSSEGQHDVALPIWLGGKKPGRKYSEQTAYSRLLRVPVWTQYIMGGSKICNYRGSILDFSLSVLPQDQLPIVINTPF